MKKWIFIPMFLLTFQGFGAEQEVQFVYHGTEEDYEAYYSCSYAKEQAQRFIKLVGGEDIIVSCSGGLRGPYDWHIPLSLTASFNFQIAPRVVEVKSDPIFTACAMNTRLINSIVKTIPKISILEKRDKCSDPKSPFYYKLRIQE